MMAKEKVSEISIPGRGLKRDSSLMELPPEDPGLKDINPRKGTETSR